MLPTVEPQVASVANNCTRGTLNDKYQYIRSQFRLKINSNLKTKTSTFITYYKAALDSKFY